jgi:hypothetical protein
MAPGLSCTVYTPMIPLSLLSFFFLHLPPCSISWCAPLVGEQGAMTPGTGCTYTFPFPLPHQLTRQRRALEGGRRWNILFESLRS